MVINAYVFRNRYIESSVVFFPHKVPVGKIAKQTMHVNLRPFYGKKLLARDCVIYQVCCIGIDQWSKWIFTKTCLGKSPGSS